MSRGTRRRRILVYRIGQIGDTVVALPALWAVRAYFNDASITLMTDASPNGHSDARSVLPETGLIDEWLVYPIVDAGAKGPDLRMAMETLFRLRHSHYDILVNLSPRERSRRHVLRDEIFFRLAGIRRFIGQKGFDRRLPRPCGEPLPLLQHEADHLLDRLKLDGIPVPDLDKRVIDLALTPEDQRVADAWLTSSCTSIDTPIAGVCFGGKVPSKMWPLDNYIDLGKRLHSELGVYPAIFGGPADAEIARHMLQKWGTGASAAGVLSVRQAAAALKRCCFYVGNDTGTMHLAAAVGTRCVAIMSARDWPGMWNPYGEGHVVIRQQVACEGCRLQVCVSEGLRCLTQVTVDQAFEACRITLARCDNTAQEVDGSRGGPG